MENRERWGRSLPLYPKGSEISPGFPTKTQRYSDTFTRTCTHTPRFDPRMNGTNAQGSDNFQQSWPPFFLQSHHPPYIYTHALSHPPTLLPEIQGFLRKSLSVSCELWVGQRGSGSLRLKANFSEGGPKQTVGLHTGLPRFITIMVSN